MNDIYKMDLHECIYISNHEIDIIRVPGGWLYKIYELTILKDCIFIPYHNEFQK